MTAMIQDLVRHKAWADAALVGAIRESAPADQELLKLLHHMILANRFWLALCIGRPFDAEAESRVPDGLDSVTILYRQTQRDELEWISSITGADLSRRVETHYLPGQSFAVPEALMQVCMHSQGHRSQCAARLRSLGGTPPTLDFLLWLKDRPAPAW